MSTAAFRLGMGVTYEPTKEDGVVTSTNERYVFVRFSPVAEHGVACRPEDLTVLAEAVRP